MAPTTKSSLPTITLEEHYISSSLSSENSLHQRYANFPGAIASKLSDLSSDGPRLQSMNAGNVTLQVISHAPGASSSIPSDCRSANDELASAIKTQPSRFAGFAALPMAHPNEAAAELERCVRDLGFVGALVDNHTAEGKFYDGEDFWPVFAKAQELDVPLYIHPTFPTEEMSRILYNGNYSAHAAMQLGIAGWGWHQTTGLHVLRLHAAGVFDRFPKVKIVIGHDGELIPFQLERSDKMSAGWVKREDAGGVASPKSLKQVWDENIWVTTSGMFSVNPMACLLRNTRIERILYSVDWPFSENEMGWDFLQALKDSGLLKEGDLEKMAYENAEQLLKVKAVR